MCKRWIVLLMCLAVLVSIVLPIAADSAPVYLSISSAAEFLSFAESCRLDSYSQGLIVTLEADINLDTSASVPIFSGTFDGNGHKISGLSITADGSVQGLFRYLTTTAVIQNLTVLGELHPGGSRNQIGAIAGYNAGTIRNCTFSGTVSGGDYVGGLVGSNAVTGIIEGCQVNGKIYGDHFVGGIAGKSSGVIRNCSSTALVNTTPQQNDIEITDITIDTLTNTESASTVTDIGGICGISSGVIRECKNFGDVGYQHIGYNIGGICGTQSGYIADCENQGNVHGRKEIGGIVGQMEPNSLIEYTEDALQILQGQLGELSGLVKQASWNAQANASQITSQIGVLENQAQSAQDAVNALIPDQDNPGLPDLDTSLAALNTLNSSLNAISGTMGNITAATRTTVNSLSRDLGAISAKIGVMEQTVNGASENLGGSIVDVSDEDTPENLIGKVENCINYGTVLGDLNVGGIAGAMAMENDLDILEDLEQLGEESLNFETQIRAVVLNCKNNAAITGGKQNAGGIVGWQSLGLVKSCTNTGILSCPNADYVGGISGLSTGYIRQNFARCEIHASTYAGGIAGSGTIVTDCLTQVKIAECSEQAGAILGAAKEVQEETPISGNQYLVVGQDFGAIDGISYMGLAESISLDAFLQAEYIPEIFKTVTVRFIFPNGEMTVIPLTPGSSLDPANIPTIPEKDGRLGTWEGLESADLVHIMFDISFSAEYFPRPSVIASTEVRENGLPILLLEGSFAESASVHVTMTNQTPALAKKDSLMEAWAFHVGEVATQARFLLPESIDITTVKLMVCNAEEQWREVSYTQDGSYLVFPLASGDRCFALVEVASGIPIWVIAAAVLVVLLPVPIVIAVKKKKMKTAAEKTV